MYVTKIVKNKSKISLPDVRKWRRTFSIAAARSIVALRDDITFGEQFVQGRIFS
jgi:hypothetical protein